MNKITKQALLTFIAIIGLALIVMYEPGRNVDIEHEFFKFECINGILHSTDGMVVYEPSNRPVECN